jgi:putative membrane protein
MMWWTDNDLSGWGWGAMTISMVLFWGLLILAGVLLVRSMNRPSGGPAHASGPTPQEVLADRFARGEIDQEEYHQRLAALSSAGLASKP